MFAASLGYWKASPNVDPATGGTITQIEINGIPYNVHTFSGNASTQIFSVKTSTLNCLVLLVGGGGGANPGGKTATNAYVAGGGGSGACYQTSVTATANTNYNIFVSLGQTVVTSQSKAADTTAFGFTVQGGGCGGVLAPQIQNWIVPGSGGSGGAGSASSTLTGGAQNFQGAASSTQFSTYNYGVGNNGGSASYSAPNLIAGNGGSAAFASSITGQTINYAIGGTGSRYNTTTQVLTAGTKTSRPGSGGAGGGTGTDLNGADGVVIIRYPLIV